MGLRDQPYLQPYLDAAATHGAGFGSLLWASPITQAARFATIQRINNLHGVSLLDVGCGRADLLAYLLERGVQPARYVGIEVVDALANAADGRKSPNATILRADFVAEPLRLFVGADVVVFCGSLNTADDSIFYRTLSQAFDAAGKAVVFNFLCSPMLAGQDYLYWRQPDDVVRFARNLSPDVTTLADYLPGDMTLRIGKTA
jgi:SAM-dependent methyltransferase